MSEVTATTDNKVKKPVHRSRSWKNEKRGKLFYDCQKSNKDCDKRSKNSKSVTTSPCRPTDQNFYNSQIHSDLDFHSGDIKPTHYPGVLSPEAISSMSTLCAQTPSTSPSWFYRSSSSCKLMTGKNLDTLKSPLYLSPTSKTVSPTVNSPGGFFTTNTQNKSHQEESGCPVKNSPQTDSTVCHGNYSGSGTSSFMTNLKVAFNRFFDNIRNKNNNIPSNNNNNNTNSNNSDNNTNVTPSRKQSKLHLPSLVKSTVQQFSPSSQPSPTSPFAVSSIVCSSSAESEFQGDFKCRRPDSLCKSKSSVYSPDKMSSGENNTDENKCDNTKELKETELLARTLYATVSREIEIEAKEKRRRQHHSSVGSRPSSHFTCCYHVRPYDNRSNHSSADSPNQSYTEKKVSPGSSYHTDKLGDGINIHNNDSNNHNYDKMK
uniref:Uncharacterized protein n=1 Tax=Trichobilharzia regenti TaxID=157069 RepID=A0AA85JS69_TRIRE|nr:unnamed protein product [Trichobilharzia regenti]